MDSVPEEGKGGRLVLLSSLSPTPLGKRAGEVCLRWWKSGEGKEKFAMGFRAACLLSYVVGVQIFASTDCVRARRRRLFACVISPFSPLWKLASLLLCFVRTSTYSIYQCSDSAESSLLLPLLVLTPRPLFLHYFSLCPLLQPRQKKCNSKMSNKKK